MSIATTLVESGADAEFDDQVLGDPVLLEAMVENLVRNAVRFSPRGSRLEVVVEVQDDSVVLFVRDRGQGVAAEHAVAVFDWFFEVPTHRRRSPGSGFGLAIAKRIAEHHDGTIALRNRDEGGSEFEVRLPRWSGDVAEDRVASRPEAPAVAPL